MLAQREDELERTGDPSSNKLLLIDDRRPLASQPCKRASGLALAQRRTVRQRELNPLLRVCYGLQGYFKDHLSATVSRSQLNSADQGMRAVQRRCTNLLLDPAAEVSARARASYLHATHSASFTTGASLHAAMLGFPLGMPDTQARCAAGTEGQSTL